MGWLPSERQEVSAGEDVEKREPLWTAGGNVNWCSHFKKQYGGGLKKLKIESAIPLLGIYLKKMKTLIWNDICPSMFITALFIIAKIWRQPKCPLIGMDKEDEWTYLDI